MMQFLKLGKIKKTYNYKTEMSTCNLEENLFFRRNEIDLILCGN